MRNIGRLRNVEDKLTEDLKRTTIPLRQLGKKYGVTYQSIFDFAHRRGIKRPKRTKREHIEYCIICQSIINIAKKPHSDFISSRTIKKQLGLGSREWDYHIHILREKDIVSARFGRLHSRKAELAYQLYFKKKLSLSAIGSQVGLMHFHAFIKRHRALGWDVPAPLLEYDSTDRRKAALKKRKKSKI